MGNVSLQQLLKGNHRSLLVVIDALPFPIYYKDREGLYLGCNKAYEEYVGATREEIIGKRVYDLFDKISASIFDATDKELIENPGVQIYETPVHRSGQETRYVKFEKATFVDEEGEIAGLIGAIIDITEQKNLEAKLKRLASYDDLTGIYNRREGRKQLKRLCKDAARKERPISAILLDLDNFKAINDNYGHDTGDIILKTAAECLDRYSRANDVLCRYGGEEFLIILPETNLDDAVDIAERYRERLAQIEVQITSSETLRITASFGVGKLDPEFTDRDLMLKQADLALYRAKDQGKNKVCY